MIKELTSKDLSDVELRRYRRFKKHHEHAHCYYTTEFSLGAGYDILATTLTINNEKDLLKVNLKNSEFITDEVKELESF